MPDVVTARDMLRGPADEVAPRLLGWTLTSTTDAGVVRVELTEVEAYAGHDDPASHAHRGPTARTAVMFGPAGVLYVYRSYGLHWCANVVCGRDGEAAAVLLRAGRVVEGLDIARRRRGPGVSDAALARGPACLTRALGIEGTHDAVPLLAGPPLQLAPGTDAPAADEVGHGPRVGVSTAADVAWRFWRRADPTVSTYRRSPRAPVPPPPAAS